MIEKNIRNDRMALLIGMPDITAQRFEGLAKRLNRFKQINIGDAIRFELFTNIPMQITRQANAAHPARNNFFRKRRRIGFTF